MIICKIQFLSGGGGGEGGYRVEEGAVRGCGTCGVYGGRGVFVGDGRVAVGGGEGGIRGLRAAGRTGGRSRGSREGGRCEVWGRSWCVLTFCVEGGGVSGGQSMRGGV